MEDNIYKAMPILNTLGINVNQYAPDNNALLFGKALLGIATDVFEQKKESEFNSKVAQINQLELDFKNKVLVNKDIDLQDPEKRAEIFKIANDLTEKQKGVILNYKHLDSNDIQKLEGILIKGTGERAFNLQNDTNKIMIKQSVDNSIATIEEFKKQGESVDYQDKAMLENIYASLPKEYETLKANGMPIKEIQKMTSESISKIEGSVTSKYLNNVIINSGTYDTIPQKRSTLSQWHKDNVSDEALEKKVDEITKNYPSTVDTEERSYLKAVLKTTYDNEYMKANAKIYDLEVDYYAQVRTEQAMSDAAKLQADATRDQTASMELIRAKEKADEAFQSNDLRGLNSMKNNRPSMASDVLRESFLIEVTGLSKSDLIKNMAYVDSFTDKEISELKSVKDITIKNGNDMYSFYNSNISGILKVNSVQDQEMMLRELHKKGVFDYNTAKLIQGKDENKKRDIINMQQYMNTGAGFNNKIDTSKLSHNDFLFKLMSEKMKNNPVAQKMFIDYYSGKNQSGELGVGVHLSNGKDFGTSLNVRTKNDENLRNDMMKRSDYFVELSKPANFTKAQYNPNIRNTAAESEAGILTNIKAPVNKNSKQRLKSQEGKTSSKPVYKNSGKSDTPPPKPSAPKNGNSPATKGQQLKSIL